MITTAIRQSQYQDETGRHAIHKHGEHVGEFTEEYLQWLPTADLEYFAIKSHTCYYVLGPRRSKVAGHGVPSFCTCFEPGAKEKAASVVRWANAEAGTPVPDPLAQGRSIEEAEREAADAVRASMAELDLQAKGSK